MSHVCRCHSHVDLNLTNVTNNHVLLMVLYISTMHYRIYESSTITSNVNSDNKKEIEEKTEPPAVHKSFNLL